MFGLEDRHIIFIKKILANNISLPAKFYIFGSRAKGNYKEYSDIDIAIDLNGKRISANILGKILMEFEDSTLPYEVDIIDLNAIDANFKNIIKEELVEF